MRQQLVGLACIACVFGFGCGDGADPPWDPGDPLPAICDGESGLEATIDGQGYQFAATTTSAQPGSTWLQSPVVVGQPWHMLGVDIENPPTTEIGLPDSRVRLTYSMNPNGAPSVAQVYLTTDVPLASNWSQAVASGEVRFVEAGPGVGDRRCGWIDVTLDWTPVGGSPRTVRARGAFDSTVIEYPEDQLAR